MAPTIQNKEDIIKTKDEPIKRKAQKTLFGIKGYHITIKEMKKIGKNSWKLTGKEYLKIDKNTTFNDKLGIYKEQCEHCLKEFQNKSGLASHQQWCKAAIAAKQKREIEESIEMKSSHDTTVFVANNMTNNVNTDGWRKRMHTSRADERTRRNLERSSIMRDNTTEDANQKTDGH